MTRFLDSLALFFALNLDRLRRQLLTWPEHTRWLLRALLAVIAARLAQEFGDVFTQLPDGWPGAVIAHLPSVAGVFVAVMLLLFAAASFGLGLLSMQAAKTL